MRMGYTGEMDSSIGVFISGFSDLFTLIGKDYGKCEILREGWEGGGGH